MSDIRIKMAKDLRDMSDMVGDLHWMAAKAVEDLIKKDARIAELEALSVTKIMLDIVPGDGDGYEVYAKSVSDVENKLGALVEANEELQFALEQLRTELAALKAQEPVAWVHFHNGRVAYDRDWIISSEPGDCLDESHDWRPVYAAPVPEAKAQGVVMPERKPWRTLGHAVQFHAQGWNECLDEVARLNATPVQHPDDDAVDRFAVAMKIKLAASREKGRHGWQNATGPHLSSLLHEHMYKGDPLDVGNLAMMLHQNGQAIELPHDARRVTAPVQQVSVPDVSAMARILADRNADACNVNREDNWAIYGQDYIDDVTAMLAAAPAAPAADAGLVLEQSMYTLISIGYHENSGLVHELRQAISANRAKGVV